MPVATRYKAKFRQKLQGQVPAEAETLSRPGRACPSLPPTGTKAIAGFNTMQSNIPSGKIAFVDEILATKSNGSFRVTGHLASFDASNLLELNRDVATITSTESKGKLQIRTNLLEDFPFKIGALFQFIGEFNAKEKFLRARVARNVDGMDTKLYAEAIKLCRKHGRLPM
eukprot:jgi/Bigna1/90750/estExt_fgenesh1_pg.C_780059